MRGRSLTIGAALAYALLTLRGAGRDVNDCAAAQGAGLGGAAAGRYTKESVALPPARLGRHG